MIYGNSHRRIACMIDYEGFPKHEAELARAAAWDRYTLWWRAVRILRARMLFEMGLTLWNVKEIGAEREPWANVL